MFDDIRKNKIFTLLEENEYKLNGEKIGKLLSISDRTIRKEIKEMNEVCKNHGFLIKNMRGEGLYFNVFDQQNFLQFKGSRASSPLYFDINTKDGRMKQCVLILLNENQYMTLEELAEKMYVSRTTISHELNGIRSILNHNQLTLHSKVGKGILIEGTEIQKRNTLISIIDDSIDFSQIETYFEWKEQKEYVQTLQKKLPLLFNIFHLYFTDENLNNFIYYLVVMADRIKHQFVLDLNAKEKNSEPYTQLMDQLIALLTDTFGMEISESEKDYLFIQVKSKVIVKSDQDPLFNEVLDAYIQSFLDKINENYYYDLKNDEQLINDLKSHIHSMLYRAENNIRVRNPMEEHIKKYFPLAYEVTLYAIRSIKDEFPYEINLGEIAYLALHIGASLERNYQVKYERHNSCLIVCGSGFGTARMIETTIKQAIPNLFITKTISAQKYSALPYIEEDVVITSVQIEEKNKPVFKIETLPSKKEIIELDKKITREISQTTDLLLKYFSPTLFFKRSFKNKEDAIKTLTQAMAEEKVIENEEEFTSAILKREELGSTLIGEGVAIPHPLNLLSKRTQIGIALAEEPINWGNGQQTQLIFLLAISKEDYEEAMGIYDFIVEIIRENHAYVLSTARSFNEFILKAKMIYE
ncbi:BglG family transcription antiterminator [Alkalicoccobacillus murimartini]|uniref:Transcriptional antiterminator n=1 Tax=Alkalicoccobacillus murimartini TaxID=171685 RepID=A0ABT9YFU4_9BACI|nr:PTS sugar transporter subunit IIA [Alkalicoccobacillus murimartini]MDQ0206370.1 transcriptional antiterminator [Alkalicoccobacillus murimartini]